MVDWLNKAPFHIVCRPLNRTQILLQLECTCTCLSSKSLTSNVASTAGRDLGGIWQVEHRGLKTL